MKLVGVKIKKAYTSPAGLLDSGASWATTFSEEAIIKAFGEGEVTGRLVRFWTQREFLWHT